MQHDHTSEKFGFSHGYPGSGVVLFDFPIGIQGQVWYLIVSIPDLCTLTYFDLLIPPQGFGAEGIGD